VRFVSARIGWPRFAAPPAPGAGGATASGTKCACWNSACAALPASTASSAGVPPKLRHFHVLKHTCATHLLAKGFHIEQVQDWIGHADIRNTMIYAHITNARRDQMAQALRDWK